jgi:uncharacterized membrane protein
MDETPTTNGFPRLLIHVGNYTAIACVAGFSVLIAIRLYVHEPAAHRHEIVATVAFALLSGIVCISSYILRAMLEWRQNQWRYSICQLISWMTVVALVLTMLMYALSSR